LLLLVATTTSVWHLSLDMSVVMLVMRIRLLLILILIVLLLLLLSTMHGILLLVMNVSIVASVRALVPRSLHIRQLPMIVVPRAAPAGGHLSCGDIVGV